MQVPDKVYFGIFYIQFFFLQKFLHPVFTQKLKALGNGEIHLFGRHCFGDCHHLDIIIFSAVFYLCFLHIEAYLLDIFGNIGKIVQFVTQNEHLLPKQQSLRQLKFRQP